MLKQINLLVYKNLKKLLKNNNYGNKRKEIYKRTNI